MGLLAPQGHRLSRRTILQATAGAALGAAATAVLPGATQGAIQHPPTIGVAASAGAQDADVRFRALDAAIEAARTSAGIPGVAVSVRYPGGEYLAGYGVTNVESPQPVDGDTLFQIGSITKTMTMAACLRLVEQGRLDLATPIREYLPDLQLSDPSAAAVIALQHLLTHTSGLPADHFVAMGGGDDALARYAASLGTIPFVLPPGEWYAPMKTCVHPGVLKLPGLRA